VLLRRKLLSILQYILGIGLGGLLLYISVKDLEWSRFQSELEGASYWWLLPAGLVGYMSHFLRALRWKILIGGAGYQPNLHNAFWSVMVGYMVNNVVPRLGELTSCTMLSRSDRVPFMTGAGTVFTERAADMLVLIMMLPIVFLLQYDELLQAIAENRGSSGGAVSNMWLYIAGGAFLLTALLLFLFRRPILATPFGQKLKEMYKNLMAGITSIRRLEKFSPFVLCSLGIWTMYILFVFTMLRALPAASDTGLYFAFVATAMGAIGMVIPSPGGIGSYHFVIMLTFVMFGYEREMGSTAALVLHTPQYLFALLGGIIGYFVLLLKRPNSPAQQPAAQAQEVAS
jgi:hypothetical protein